MKKTSHRVNKETNKKNIYLVGFMATGKTTVGQALAKKKKWYFLDLDNLIELREKRSINDIFAKDGEAYFRRIEKRTLKDVSREKKFIIACGGGIVLDRENIDLMKSTGVLICLNASVDVILKRTHGFTCRPLLNTPDPQKQIETLLQFRAPFYAKADYTINTSDLTIDEAVGKIIDILKKK